MNSFKLLMGVLAAIGMVACGGTEIVGSKYVKADKVPATQGLTIEVSASDSAVLAGTRLEVAAGALANDTTITLEVGMANVVKNAADKAGPVAVWGPAGLKFTKPVKMTLPFELPNGKAKSDLSIIVKEADGTMLRVKNSELTIDSASNKVSFMVSGFTSFQPSTQPQCTADADCSTGEVCITNVCTRVSDGGPGGGAGGGGAGGGAGGGTGGGAGGGVGGGTGGGTGGAGGGGGTGGGTGGGLGGGAGGGTGGAGGGGTGGAGGGGGTFCRNDFECVLGEICINMTCTPGVIDGGSGGGTGGAGGGSVFDGGTGGGGGGPSDGGSGGGGGGASDGGPSDGGTGGGGGGPSDGGSGGGGGGPSDGGSGGGAGGGTGGGGGSDAGSAFCASSLDCPMPEVCLANQCVAISCVPARPCPSQFTCVSGWCQ